MAENKTSFIGYTDWVHTFEQLKDAEAGKLIKHFLRYVNDQNPKAPDRITALSFEPLKRQLKRDLKKWEVEQVRKRHAGLLGNLKRWHKDIYDKFMAGEITWEESQNIAKGRTPINSIAEIAVNVDVNEYVNVNGSSRGDEPATMVVKESLISDWNNTKIKYSEANDEFKKLYTEELFNSWRRFNKWINENCPYIRERKDQIKIHEYQKIHEGIVQNKHTLKQVQQALTDLNDNQTTMNKYTSVYGGFTRFLATVVKNDR